MTSSATPIGKLMSYSLTCHNVLDGVFVPLRQTRYASKKVPEKGTGFIFDLFFYRK